MARCIFVDIKKESGDRFDVSLGRKNSPDGMDGGSLGRRRVEGRDALTAFLEEVGCGPEWIKGALRRLDEDGDFQDNLHLSDEKIR